MEIKLPFGLKNGRIIHISEVTEDERGLKCNCICPKCKQRLIARLGDKRIRHFAHNNEQCRYALETSLHIFAKEVLESSLKMYIPRLSIEYRNNYTKLEDFDKEDMYYSNEYELKEKVILKKREIFFDRVELEKRIDNIIPDVVLYKNGQPLIIEIAVTHFINDDKRNKIIKQGISTIEINLQRIKFDYHNFDREEVANLIINDVQYKQWIYNRKVEEEKKKIIEENKLFLEEESRIREKEEKRRMEYILKQEQKHDLKIKRLKELLEPSNYKKKLTVFDQKLETDKLWIQISKVLSLDKDNMPLFLNTSVEGVLAFECDPRIWQSYILKKFVLGRKGKIIKVFNVIKWIKNHSSLPTNKDLLYTKDVFSNGIPDLTDAVIEYLMLLREYGFLEKTSYNVGYYSQFEVVYDRLLDFKGLEKEEIRHRITVEKIKLNINKKQPNIEDSFNFTYGVNTMPSQNGMKVPISVEKTIRINEKYGTCNICGSYTNDWIIYSGFDETCTCRDCNEKKKHR